MFFLEFNLYNGGWHVFSLVSVSSLYSLLGSGSVDHVISCVSCLRTSPQRMAKSVAIINSYLFLSNCHRYKSDSKHHFVSKSIIIIINDYLMSINYNRVEGNDPVDCDSNSNDDPFQCTTITSPNATISLYLGRVLPESREGFYKCCLPTDCTSATNTITVNIFSKKVYWFND